MQTDLSNNDLLDFTNRPLVKRYYMQAQGGRYSNTVGGFTIDSSQLGQNTVAPRPIQPAPPETVTLPQQSIPSPTLTPATTAPNPYASSSQPTTPVDLNSLHPTTVNAVQPTTAPASTSTTTTTTPSTTTTTYPDATNTSASSVPQGGGGGGGGMAPPEQSQQGSGDSMASRSAPEAEKTSFFKSFWFWGMLAGAGVAYYLVKKKGYAPKKTFLLSAGIGGGAGYVVEMIVRKHKGVSGKPQITAQPQQQTPAPQGQPTAGKPAM